MVNTRQNASEQEPTSPSSPSLSSAPRTPPHERSPPALRPIDRIEAEEQEIRHHIRRLERIQAQRDYLNTLIAELNRNPIDSAPNQYRFGRDTDVKRDIKIDDVPTFKMGFSIQKRQEWLINLDIVFKAAPRQYDTDARKIYGAQRFMNSSCRVKWAEFVNEKPPEQQQEYTESWDAFEKWTLSLIQNSASLQADVRDQIEKAFQLPHQDPREFHSYLHSREQHLDRESEMNRALNFFAKLQPQLKKSILSSGLPLPKTRDEMVTTAVRYWSLNRPTSTLKRPLFDTLEAPYPNQEPKRPRTNEFRRSTTDSPRPFNPNWKRSSPNENPANRPRNPTGSTGRTLRCFICDSQDHLKPNCPYQAQVQAIVRGTEWPGNAPGSE